MNWNEAKAHFDATYQLYLDARQMPGISVERAIAERFRPLAQRYRAGERSRELYEAMRTIE